MNPTNDPNPGDLNVERLVQRSYRPDPVPEGLVERVEQAMLAAARERELTPARQKAWWARPAVLAGLSAAAMLLLATGLWLGLHDRVEHKPGNGTALRDPVSNSEHASAATTRDSAASRHSGDPRDSLGSRPSDAPPVSPSPGGIAAGGVMARSIQPAPVVRAKAGETIQTAAGQKRRLTLEDGSVLYVNRESLVTIDSSRQISVRQGEAFVEVAPMEGRRFIVKTPSREVVALGTRFGVNVKQQGTGVVVTQGKVRVSGVADIVDAGRELMPDGRIASAPRASASLDWLGDLLAVSQPLIPASHYAGGALTVRDASGQESRLELRRFHVDVYVEDGFARTTIDQTYFNNQYSRMEGTFYFPLPADAGLSRLAMYVDGRLMEGGMAERETARAVYESIVHARKDPALLEWVDGTTFKMRVFPLEARQEKRIILSYVQRLSPLYGRTTYRFPQGHSLGEIGQWSFHAMIKGGAGFDWKSSSHAMRENRAGEDLALDAAQQKIKPDQDVVLTLWGRADTGAARFASQEFEGARYLMLRWRPELPAQPRKERRDWVFLYESSAARDPVLARAQVEIIRTMLQNAEHEDTFAVVSAGTRAVSPWKGRMPATAPNIEKAIRFLESQQLIGAMNLGKALDAAGALCADAPGAWLVHVGTGIDVMGPRSDERLVQKIPPGVRYAGIGVGKRWSRQFMKLAASRTGGHVAQINPDENVAWRAFDLLATLNTPRLLDVKVIDPAEKVRFLSETDALAQGEQFCAAARLENGEAMPESIIVSGTLDGHAWKQQIKVERIEPGAGYLARFWAKLEIDRLVAAGAEANKPRIVELSKSMYVMSPFTSLLVLENEAMYQQYHIDRGRKDHWAMYRCPEKIEVVTENPPAPATQPLPQTRPAAEVAREQRQAKIDQCLATVVIRGTRFAIAQPGQPFATPTMTAQAALLRAWGAPVVWWEAEDGGLMDLNGAMGRPAHYWNWLRVYDIRDLSDAIPDFDNAPDFSLSDATLRLSGANTYTGGVTINGGTLIITRGSRGGGGRGYWGGGGGDGGLFGSGTWTTWNGRYGGPMGTGYVKILDGEPNRWDLSRTSFVMPGYLTYGNGVYYGNYDYWAGSGTFVDGTFINGTGTLTPGSDLSGNGWMVPPFIVHDGRPVRLSIVPGVPLDGTIILSAPHDRYLIPGSRDIDLLINRSHAEIHQARLDQLTGPASRSGAMLDDARGRTVSQLLERAQDSIRRRDYRGSLRALDQILAVDPKNEYARGVYPLVYDQYSLTDQRKSRGGWERSWTNSLNSAEERKIPYEDILRYPENWPDISAWRDAEVRSQRAARQEDLAVQAQLDRRLPEVNFNGQGLAEVVEFLRDISGLNIFVNWRALEAEGINRDAPVTTRMKDVRLSKALTTILVDVGGGNVKLEYAVDEGVLIISTAKDLSRQSWGAWGAMLYQRPIPCTDSGLFTDLLIYAPGLNTSPADIAAVIEREVPADKPVGTVDAAARRLIDGARQARWMQAKMSGGTMKFDGAGRFAIDRRTSEGLRELVICDGATMWHLYPELGLGAKRTVSRFHRAQLAAAIPWMMLPADDLASVANVVSVGEDAIALEPFFNATTRPSSYHRMELRFAAGRLVERSIVEMPGRKTICRQSLGEDGVSVIFDGQGKEAVRRRIEISLCDAPSLAPEVKELVVLPMPWRSHEHVLKERQLREGDYGNWTEGDKLAMLAADVASANNPHVLVNEAFVKRGDRRPGLSTLMLSCSIGVDPAQMGISAEQSKSPLAKYLARAFKLLNGDMATAWPELQGEGFLGRMSELAQLQAALSGGITAESFEKRWAPLLRQHKDSELAWPMALRARDRLGSVAAVEQTLAEISLAAAKRPGLAYAANFEAARALAGCGQLEKSRKIFAELYRSSIEQGVVPSMDDDFYRPFSGSESGRAQLARLMRESAKKLSERFGPIAAIEQSVQLRQRGQVEIAQELFEEALGAVKPDAPPAIRLAAVRYLHDAQEYARALEMLQPLLESKPGQAAAAGGSGAAGAGVWRLAAHLADRRGNAAMSAQCLDRAVEIELAALPDGSDVNSVRAPSAELLAKYETIAAAMATLGQSPSKELIDRVLHIADRWRTLDPDPTQPCQAAARVLKKLGCDELAWAYLTTPLAQKNTEAQPWQSLGSELAQQGEIALADRAYATAFDVEPTNAQALWDRAELLRSHGRSAEARQLYWKLATETWEPRFDGLKRQAKEKVQ